MPLLLLLLLRRTAGVLCTLAFALASTPASPARADEPAAAPGERARAAALGERGQLGLDLLAGGSAMLAATAAGATLLEAVTAPDDGRNKPAHPEIVQVSGFATITLASLSAGLIVVGGALLMSDVRE